MLKCLVFEFYIRQIRNVSLIYNPGIKRKQSKIGPRVHCSFSKSLADTSS